MAGLYVRESYRGKGLAQSLLRELAVVAKREKISRIQWEVRAGNMRPRRFYDKVWLAAKKNFLTSHATSIPFRWDATT